MRTLLFVALGVLSLGFAGAQTPAEALRAPAKSLKAADLPEGSRAVLLNGTDAISPLFIFGMAGGGSSEDARSNLLLSLLGATFVDPDEFALLLDGKRPRIRGYALDFNAALLDKPRGEGTPNAPEPTFVETWIEAGRVLQWSPRPGLTRESILRVLSGTDTAKPAAVKSQAISNAKQIGLGMMMYAADYDDAFPAADSTARVQPLVAPYLKNDALWSSPNPEGGRLLYNTSLSKVSQAMLENIAEVPLLWDEKPWPDGGRVVAYADGHVGYATREAWEGTIWPFELRRRAAARKPATRPAAAMRRP